ncbi:MAG: YidC/Oxa1 family membrane protein insertase [Clostridium sp.]|jgi:YidC/Oxa1 family membrane protein insertase|nr:YidC/Oxa1 family membrane protein insertase [Clostridium sp.]
MGFISQFLGQILLFIYENLSFGSYGLAIILFTLLVKVLLLPLTVKQYRSSAKLREIQPLIQEIQRKYKNDKEKQTQEMMKIYQEHNCSPTGGCFTSLIQLPILFSLLYVVRSPLTYMFNMTKEQITDLITASGLPEDIATKSGYWQMDVALKSGKLDMIENFGIFDMNLGIVPKLNPFGDPATYLPLLFLVIFAVVTTYLSTKVMMNLTQGNINNPAQNSSKDPKSKSAEDMSASMTKSMMFIAPVMTAFISFQAPAALVLYWLTNNVFQMLQQYFIHKVILKKKEDQVK